MRAVALSTGLGAASSSCSYAAVAIARSLFAKGASAASALAFQFASTNLVVELGIVLWVLIGWQFTLAEFVGGCFSSYRCRCWCACSSLSASNARRASMRAARAAVTPTSQ